MEEKWTQSVDKVGWVELGLVTNPVDWGSLQIIGLIKGLLQDKGG